jgi:hypothetical protein
LCDILTFQIKQDWLIARVFVDATKLLKHIVLSSFFYEVAIWLTALCIVCNPLQLSTASSIALEGSIEKIIVCTV